MAIKFDYVFKLITNQISKRRQNENKKKKKKMEKKEKKQ